MSLRKNPGTSRGDRNCLLCSLFFFFFFFLSLQGGGCNARGCRGGGTMAGGGCSCVLGLLTILYLLQSGSVTNAAAAVSPLVGL